MRHVIGHLLEAAEGAGTRRGDALLGLGDLPADSLVELGETGSRGGAVRLLTLARQAAGILARIGQPLLIGLDQRPSVVVGLLGGSKVARDLGIARLQGGGNARHRDGRHQRVEHGEQDRQPYQLRDHVMRVELRHVPGGPRTAGQQHRGRQCECLCRRTHVG